VEELEAMDQELSKIRQQGMQPNVFPFTAMLNGYTSHNQPEWMCQSSTLHGAVFLFPPLFNKVI